jgi:hypothetical protein
MQALTIEAVNHDSARAFADALAGFDGELIETGEDGKWLVRVALDNSDEALSSVLNELAKFITQQADGPAVLELDGHSYTLYPTDPPSPG